ncbi:MAG: hypothetical protein NTW08_00020 [Gammaproteobacteria bacterium]|nr:hypothetical protein [Gammaproteobacteria bacterium]
MSGLTKKAILKSKKTDDFIGSKCCVTISVGQSVHEEDKFKATLVAVNQHFSASIIMVCDSLQRHTMEILLPNSKEEIHEYANFLGLQWLERNLYSIKKMAIPVRISRWDEWLHHPNYSKKCTLINEQYLNDNLFKKSVDDTAFLFLSRNAGKLTLEYEDALYLSKAYLLEECAVMLLLAEEGYHFEIYPSERNAAMDYVYKHIISTFNDKLMVAVSIKFKNRANDLVVA